MSIQRRVNWLSQMRVDTPDMRAIESAVSADFDASFEAFVTGAGNPYIINGFTLNMASNPIGGAASNLQVIVSNGALMHTTASQSGTIYLVPAGTPNVTLNAATVSNVSGAFVPGTNNYVGIDYYRFQDPTTDVQRELWDPSTNQEDSTIAPASIVMNYEFVISSTTWASNILHLAVVLTDSGNNVVSITDSRPLLFRLGTGGSSPNPYYVYPWSEGTTENPPTTFTNSSNPFYGGDKAITDLKDWIDAVETELLYIGGGPYWYSAIGVGPSGSIAQLREDAVNTILTSNGNISHGVIPDTTPILTTTGNVTLGSNQITSLASTVGIASGQYISGEAFTGGTTVLSVTGSTVTMSNESQDNTYYTFTVSSANATAGAIYTNNGFNFTVQNTIVTGATLLAIGTGAPLSSGTLALSSGTGDSTIAFSPVSSSTTVSFINPVATQPGQINWSNVLNFKVIGSNIDYQIAANPTGSSVTLSDGQVAYITLTRDAAITPDLIWTNSSAIVSSVGSVTWTTGLEAGDWIKLSSGTHAGYYEIQTVNSTSQVTLTGAFSGTSTGAGGAPSQYSFGEYTLPGVGASARQIHIVARGAVPINPNTSWLLARNDDGGSLPRVYVRWLGLDLSYGVSENVSGPQIQNVLSYIGSPTDSSTTPEYVSTYNIYQGTSQAVLPQISTTTTTAGSTITPSHYFLASSSADARNYVVWFKVNGSGSLPLVANTNDAIEVDVLTSDTAAQVATKLAAALNNNLPFADFAASATGDVVTITNNSSGVSNGISNGTTPFTFATTQAGTGQGNFIVNDGDNLTLAIKKLDLSLGNLEASLDSPTYDETIEIVASGATPPSSLNGPVANSTIITLPLNSRESDVVSYYTVGKGTLQVFLNGQFLDVESGAYSEVGVAGTPSNQIEILTLPGGGLVVGDELELRFGGGGGGGGGGGEGPPGPTGPAGPTGATGADALNGPINISTKTSSYTVLGTDGFLLADCTAGNIVFTLPTAVSSNSRVFYFKKTDSTTNSMIIMGAGSDLIDGFNTLTTNVQYESFSLVSNGSSWFIF